MDSNHRTLSEHVDVGQVDRLSTREFTAVDPSFVLESVADVPIVSPSGIGHHSSGYGVTDCGVDATGPDWWWRL